MCPDEYRNQMAGDFGAAVFRELVSLVGRACRVVRKR